MRCSFQCVHKLASLHVLATYLTELHKTSGIDYNMNQSREGKSISATEMTVQKANVPANSNMFFVLEGHNRECFVMMAEAKKYILKISKSGVPIGAQW